MSNSKHSCQLSTLLAHVVDEKVSAKFSDITVAGLTLDSREVINQSVFVALNGAVTDGRLYIDAAIKLGACAVFCELSTTQTSYIEYRDQTPVIFIANLSACLSKIASEFYGHPQEDLALIGVTGTNGKTTVTQLICQWLEKLGHKAYSMGTLGNGYVGELVDSPNTTLNPIDLIAHLAKAKASGAQYVVMEVSSHGLSLGRVSALMFDVAAFTNLSQDHLDFHGDMASYANAKKSLFSARYCKNAVLNGNDLVALEWAQDWQYDNTLSSFNQKLPHASQCIMAKGVTYSGLGITANVDSSFGSGVLTSKLLGHFNLDNLLCAINVLCVCGFPLNKILAIAPKIEPIAGRMEVFQQAQSPTVVVDYAHTPDALTQTIKALRRHCHGQLIVLFGCGGDRDCSKRPLMAQAAQQHADSIVITQDNSRSESFSKILEDIKAGLNDNQNVIIEPQRTKAVQLAITQANTGDVVLLAGKGHEDYQIIESQTIAYDERELARLTVESYQ